VRAVYPAQSVDHLGQVGAELRRGIRRRPELLIAGDRVGRQIETPSRHRAPCVAGAQFVQSGGAERVLVR